jgi:Cu(I)/Ag(I) efflux system membrane fusion protein
LEFDARRVAAVPARSAGRLERVAAFPGDRVAAGQILAEIFSQDFLLQQSELLQAARRAERLRGDAEEPAARALLEAARQKLGLLGLSGPEIDAVIAARSVRPLLPVRAPIGGTVIESAAVAGAPAAADAGLFKLADTSMLWGCIHLTEKDLAAVRPGMAAAIRTQAYPGREFSGRLVLVGASMDASTRTVEGRIEIPNPDGTLKPGMYIEAWLESSERRPVLIVPASAVQEFASGRIVFVRTGPTSFVLRPVETGESLEGWIEILSGLAEGEAVVIAGGFLLKSELMKASLGDEHGHD